MTDDRRWVVRTLAIIAGLSIPTLIAPGVVAEGAGLWELGSSPSPYFASEHRWLLYAAIPVVTLSSLVLFLGPGLMLALSVGGPRSAAQWLLCGLALATVVVSFVAETAEAVLGGPFGGRAFGFAILATTMVAAIPALSGRLRRPRLGPFDRHVIWSTAVATVVLTAALLPKFLWETLNGDGGHAMETARLLLYAPTPFWGAEAGAMANYPGITTFLSSYPTAWFLRLFGDVEASARIPYLLFLGGGLFAGLIAVLEFGRADRVRPIETWLIWAGLAVFSVVMGFSATYNPYHADLALPATQDALVVAWFLGFAWAFLEGRLGWLGAFGLLAYVTSPAGTILLGLWLVAAAVAIRPIPLRMLGAAAATIVLCLVAGRLGPVILALVGQPVPGSEHAAGGLAKRLLAIQWLDWRRILYVVVPAGILPPFAILWWRRFDSTSRTLALVALAHFGFFYLQRRTALHYYAPAMLLPLVVCWRTLPELTRKTWLPLAGFATAAAALLLSLPQHRGPHLAARTVGTHLEDRLGGYSTARAVAYRRSELLSELLPRDSHRSVPDSAYGGSPLSWFYYAHRGPPTVTAYVMQGDLDPPPIGGRLVAARHGVALYVVDEAEFERDRGRTAPNTVARIYRIPKRTLFTG